MIPEVGLLKFRPWLAVHEAAVYLAKGLGLSIGGAEVLRLGIDGHLPLSIYLPVGTRAAEYRVDVAGLQTLVGVTRIEGLWELVMDSIARQQLEHDYEWAARQNYIDIGKIPGAMVGSGSYRFQIEPQEASSGFSPRPRSAFTEGGVVAIRTPALDAFIAANRTPTPEPAAAPVQEKSASDTPLRERERATLLTIIAALCHHANIDVGKPSAAGTTIEAMTEALGARVPARTIEHHLKRVFDAVERRGKEY